MAAESPSVGRLAPSPTGLLHLGHARTFLLAWWHARSRGGRILMRMEDLDTARVRPGLEQRALEDLEWLGLDWDGAVVRQSERLALYDEAFERLARAGHVYPCTCTRKEIEVAVSAPQEGDAAEPRSPYPGTCLGRYTSLDQARSDSGREPALRFRVPPGLVSFTDRFAGPFDENVALTSGDFPVRTRGGVPAYQLAVVVDDHAQGVTEVLRADDLLPSTARQALLQEALGYSRPSWIHVPLVVDAGGRRLAKRRADVSLAELRASGIDPRVLVAWIARSAGMNPLAPARPADLLPEFDLSGISPDTVSIPHDPTAPGAWI